MYRILRVHTAVYNSYRH